MKQHKQDQKTTTPRKKPWKEPKLTYLGNISDIVRGGGGKLSTPGGDPGESRGKPRGSG